MHSIYAVFEDRVDGKYLVSHSSCSCKKGEHFCSHSIGFMFIMALLQQKVKSQEDLVKYYRKNASLIQGELMLVENATIRDKFRQHDSQRKRHRNTLSC